MGPIATRTSGGTVVTFPPQNAPGSGQGETGRITSSIPAIPQTDPRRSGADDTPPVAVAPALSEMFLDPAEFARESTSESTPTDPSAERAGFLVAPKSDDRARQDLGRATESGPWLLIDPEDLESISRGTTQDPVDTAPPSFPGLESTSDPEQLEAPEIASARRVEEPPIVPASSSLGESPEDDDPHRVADLEYLFAAKTIDVGPVDLSQIGTYLPPDALGAETSESAESTESADKFDSDESLDELLAEFSAATGSPIAETVPPADEPAVSETKPISDTQPLPKIDPVSETKPVQPIPGQEPPPGPVKAPIADPAPSGGLFFDTPSRRPAKPKRSAQVEKSKAEVFASETSLLPARTRRGDRRLVEQHDAGHSWFNKSSELPLLKRGEENEPATAKPKRRGRRLLKRLFLAIVVIAVAAAILYVALNSIYL